MATTARSKPEPALSLSNLRDALSPEPLMSQRLTVRISRHEHELLQQVASRAGVTVSHATRRLLSLSAEALLAEQEAA